MGDRRAARMAGVDDELGILLSAEAMVAGSAFRRCEVTRLTIDEPMEPALFRRR